jgi:P-type Cu+ transporter
MATATTQQTEHVELALEGMTCASCATRIEKRLNKVAPAAPARLV